MLLDSGSRYRGIKRQRGFRVTISNWETRNEYEASRNWIGGYVIRYWKNHGACEANGSGVPLDSGSQYHTP